MKYILILLLLCSVCFGLDTLTRHAITWTFNDDLDTDESTFYQYGQFANGDYWIVPDSCDVVITLIDPCSITVGERTMHGSMVNPVSGSTRVQGYDSDETGWDPCYNEGRPGGNIINAGNTLDITPPASLISTVSLCS